MVLNGIEPLRTDRLCPLEDSMFIYRTKSEVDYLEKLSSISAERLESCLGTASNDLAECVREHAPFRVEFRYLRKNGPHLNVFCRNERHLHLKHGRDIPYQCLVTFGLGSEFFSRAFVRLTTLWQQIDVSRGCDVELVPFFRYRIRERTDTDSFWWVVTYVEFAAKTTAFIMFEVYDCFRL